MQASPQYTVVPDIPDELLARYLEQPEIAVDSELHGLRLGRDQVCLVQLCDRAGNVCLVRPQPPEAPPNLAKLLTAPDTMKVFHFALTDVAFMRASLGIQVHPFRCTKVMSKLARTYTDGHGLRNLMEECFGIQMDKTNQTSDWARAELSPEQLQYAANDVLHLLAVYDWLRDKLEARGTLPSGANLVTLNEQSQAVLPTLVELVLSGYGDRDQGWDTSLFAH